MQGLTLKLAEEAGISHAQLPIGQYLNMKTRKVLAINHVFEILLKFSETKNWEDAFFAVIPQRKLPQILQENDGGNTSNDSKVVSKTLPNSLACTGDNTAIEGNQSTEYSNNQHCALSACGGREDSEDREVSGSLQCDLSSIGEKEDNQDTRDVNNLQCAAIDSSQDQDIESLPCTLVQKTSGREDPTCRDTNDS